MNWTGPNDGRDGITVARQPVIYTRFLINSLLRETNNGVDDVSNNERIGTKIAYFDITGIENKILLIPQRFYRVNDRSFHRLESYCD
jgi:hypothetical protein